MERMKILKKLNVVLLIGVLAAVAACKKSAPPAIERAPEKATELPMPSSRQVEAEMAPISVSRDAAMERALEKRYPGRPAEQEAVRSAMSAVDALGDARKKLDALNQRIMVIPAPADFRPESVARKVRLNLILEKATIRAGENPRFRLELTNVGRETIDYQEYESSIFKWGSILHSIRTIRFYLTDQVGKRLKLRTDLYHGQASPVQNHTATPESEKEMQEINALGQASTTFRVKLRPGDTLRSLGDGDSAQEPFRTLFVQGGFKKPGVYQLQVELDDRPKPLNKHYIEYALKFSSLDEIKKTQEREFKEALGPLSSNVTLEVLP
jgi:hypothetical protein